MQPPSNMRDAQGVIAEKFMQDLFEFEYCCECHRDMEHHQVVLGPFGNWFARCNYEHSDDCIICKESK